MPWVSIKEKSLSKWSFPLVYFYVTVVKTVSNGFHDAYHCSFKKMKLELILLMKIEEGKP